jgi:hypothetical protein
MVECKFSFTVLDLGTSWNGQLHAAAAFSLLPIGQEAGWAPEQAWALLGRRNLFPPPRIEPRPSPPYPSPDWQSHRIVWVEYKMLPTLPFLCGGVRLSPLGTSATIWPLVPVPVDGRWCWAWSSRWNDWQGKSKYSEKTCPGAALPTAHCTWLDLSSNPGRRCGKPATSSLNYGMASNLHSVP